MNAQAGMPAIYRAQILESLATAVLVFDGGLNLFYINPAGEMMFEVSAAKAQGLSFKYFVGAQDQIEGRFRAAMQSGDPYAERELQLEIHGHGLTVDCIVSPMPWHDGGNFLLVEWTRVDRQMRISREENLLEQHHAARDVIRGLAHEIKNPLGGLRGAAQLLEKELPDPDLKEFTSIIMGEADRLQRLVDRMLGPKTLPQKEPVAIHRILEHVRNLVQAEAGPGFTVHRDYDPSLPDMQGDAGMLIQAVLNIVRNAAQAMDYEGMITLRTRARRQLTIGHKRHRLVAQVQIIDEGPGIDPHIRERIFYPMITGRAEGTGLGLSIAQSLINRHGGLIECSSEPGNTVFTLLLPLECSNGKAGEDMGH